MPDPPLLPNRPRSRFGPFTTAASIRDARNSLVKAQGEVRRALFEIRTAKGQLQGIDVDVDLSDAVRYADNLCDLIGEKITAIENFI